MATSACPRSNRASKGFLFMSSEMLSRATLNGLEVSDWFEEKQTAAKRGRPGFNRMLKLLKQAKASGVVIHKIDRSARI
jgi:site-specific DNA recombinase